MMTCLAYAMYERCGGPCHSLNREPIGSHATRLGSSIVASTGTAIVHHGTELHTFWETHTI